MKLFFRCCVLLALASASGTAAADDSGTPDCSKNHYILDDPVACWQQAGPLHVARTGHTATLLLDGRVLVAGGRDDAGTSVEIYDPSTGAWAIAPPLHVSRAMHTATRLADGRVLVLGGHYEYVAASDAFAIDDTGEIYDPVADRWTAIPGPLTPRDGFTATLLADGRVLVAGGFDIGDEALASCELYDPATGAWSTTGSFGMRYWHTATALLDGRVLVAGGYEDDWFMLPLAYAQLYDPVTGLWTAAGEMSTARGFHAASLLGDGRVIVTGGEWHRCCGATGSLNGYFSAGSIAASDVYDPITNTWSSGAGLRVARERHTSTVLRDGSLLVVGGDQLTGQVPNLGRILLDSVEASPATALPWTAAPKLRTVRYGHTATLLDDGSVLVVGGSSAMDGSPLGSAEIYRQPGDSTP